MKPRMCSSVHSNDGYDKYQMQVCSYCACKCDRDLIELEVRNCERCLKIVRLLGRWTGPTRCRAHIPQLLFILLARLLRQAVVGRMAASVVAETSTSCTFSSVGMGRSAICGQCNARKGGLGCVGVGTGRRIHVLGGSTHVLQRKRAHAKHYTYAAATHIYACTLVGMHMHAHAHRYVHRHTQTGTHTRVCARTHARPCPHVRMHSAHRHSHTPAHDVRHQANMPKGAHILGWHDVRHNAAAVSIVPAAVAGRLHDGRRRHGHLFASCWNCDCRGG